MLTGAAVAYPSNRTNQQTGSLAVYRRGNSTFALLSSPMTRVSRPKKGSGDGSEDDGACEGTQNLVRHLAAKYPRPRTDMFTRHINFVNGRPKGMYTADRYSYMFYPEGSFDEDIVATDEGYVGGSSNDHFYVSVGNSVEESNLKRRERICPCTSCLNMDYGNCELVDWVGPKPTNRKIRPAAVANQMETRGAGRSLEDFCNSLSTGDAVLIKIAASQQREFPMEATQHNNTLNNNT